jgi:uncharacterized protein YgiM (DUF1202 family)
MKNKFKRIIASALAVASFAVCITTPADLSTGKNGNTFISFLEAEATPAADKEYYFYVANNNTVARKGPASYYDKVATIKKGQQVTVLRMQNGWGFIGSSNGKDKWIKLTSFKRVTPNAKVIAPSGVNVRSQPTTNSKKIKALPKGTKINIYKVHVITEEGCYWGAINLAETQWVCLNNGTDNVVITG